MGSYNRQECFDHLDHAINFFYKKKQQNEDNLFNLTKSKDALKSIQQASKVKLCSYSYR